MHSNRMHLRLFLCVPPAQAPRAGAGGMGRWGAGQVRAREKGRQSALSGAIGVPQQLILRYLEQFSLQI